MDMELALDIFWIELCHVGALMISLFLNVLFAIRAEKSHLRNRYFAVQICLLIWILSKILKTISPTASVRWFFIVTQYAGVSLLGPLFFLFAHHMVLKRDPQRFFLRLLFGGAALCFLVVATNPRHRLFYRYYDFYRDRFGPFFYAIMAYQYTLITASLAMLLGRILLGRQRAVRERLIGLAVLLPLGINIAYVFDIINPMFDITPLVMTLVLGLFALAAFRYRFLGILSLAYREIRRGVRDPLLLLDGKGRPLPYDSLRHPLDTIEELREIQPGQTIRSGKGYYRLIRRERRRGHLMEYWADVTAIKVLEAERARRIARLEKLTQTVRDGIRREIEDARRGAQKEAQQELHDTLGHSLTQVIMLLRSVEILKDDQGETREDILKKALSICQNSRAAMEAGLFQLGKKGGLLSEELLRIVEGHTGSPVSVDVILRGKEVPIPDPVRQILVLCCREGVTNGIRHGCADKIIIAVRFKKREVLILISDNGTGYSQLTPGMGLSAMAQRMASLGGIMRIIGEKGEGAQLSLLIPI